MKEEGPEEIVRDTWKKTEGIKKKREQREEDLGKDIEEWKERHTWEKKERRKILGKRERRGEKEKSIEGETGEI